MFKNFWQLISLAGMAIAVAGCSSQPAVTQSASPTTKPAALAAPKDLWVSQFQQLNGKIPTDLIDSKRSNICGT